MDDAAVDPEKLRRCAECGAASNRSDTGVDGSLRGLSSLPSESDADASDGSGASSSIHVFRYGNAAERGASANTDELPGDDVEGAGLFGREAPSSTLSGTGLSRNLDDVENVERGVSDSKGVKTNVFCRPSNSAVNVNAVCGVDEVCDGVNTGNGSGDGGSARCAPLMRPRRRIFLMLRGAVLAMGRGIGTVSSAPDAGWGGFSLSSLSFFSDDSVRRETLGMRPSVGESTMHQALPVPDCAQGRMDRAAIMSSEF